MSIFSSIKESIRNHLDKKKADREVVEKWQKEVDLQKQQIFEDEFKKNALEVARGEAKKEAAARSGLQKLRATNRARNLDNNNIAPGSFFSKLSEYTQKNLAKREENMKRTQEMRETAKKMREEQTLKRNEQRQMIMNQRRNNGKII